MKFMIYLAFAATLAAQSTTNCGVNGVQLLPNCPVFGPPAGGGNGQGNNGNGNGNPAPTPEPMTLVMVGAGLFTAAWLRRK